MSTAGLFSDGAAYERLMGRWSRAVGDRFLPWLDAPEGQHWLDVGCGTGVFTEEIVKRCRPAAVVALDPSEEQIAYARQRPEAGGAAFRVGDAQAMTFPDASFDVAVMALAIHFIPDARKAVAEMARVVRPGGLAASYVWDYQNHGTPTAPLYAALKALGVGYTPPPSAHATTMPALTELWRAAGLDRIETQVIRIPVGFADFEEFWGSMSAPVGPVGKAIAAMPAPVLDALRSRLRTAVTRGDGSVGYEACANAIKGRRPA